MRFSTSRRAYLNLRGWERKQRCSNPSASASLISCSLLSASGSLTGWVVARFFLLDLSATSLRSVWLPGLSLLSISRSCRFVFSPLSPRTRSVRERSFGYSSLRYFPTVIARKARRSAASRTGFVPRCLQLSFRRWSPPFRLVRLRVLCRHDGAPTYSGEDVGSGDEGDSAGTNPETTEHRIGCHELLS